MVLNYTIYAVRKIALFTVCTKQIKYPYTEHAASGLPNPIHFEGEAQDQQVTTRLI